MINVLLFKAYSAENCNQRLLSENHAYFALIVSNNTIGVFAIWNNFKSKKYVVQEKIMMKRDVQRFNFLCDIYSVYLKMYFCESIDVFICWDV